VLFNLIFICNFTLPHPSFVLDERANREKEMPGRAGLTEELN